MIPAIIQENSQTVSIKFSMKWTSYEQTCLCPFKWNNIDFLHYYKFSFE